MEPGQQQRPPSDGTGLSRMDVGSVARPRRVHLRQRRGVGKQPPTPPTGPQSGTSGAFPCPAVSADLTVVGPRPVSDTFVSRAAQVLSTTDAGAKLGG